MKKFLKIFLGVLFAALLLGTFVFLWQKTRPVKVVYTIVQPKLDTLKQFVVATGKVEPRDEVLIKPQISGIVSDVYKEAGQMVRKGEVIATVKVVPEMGQLSSAESRVSVAEISLAQTRREFGRTETLHDKGVVSDEEFASIEAGAGGEERRGGEWAKLAELRERMEPGGRSSGDDAKD